MPDKPLGSQVHWTSICIENFISTYFDKVAHSKFTPMDCQSLRFILCHKDEVLYAKDLMKFTNLSKATTSQTLTSLEKKGLIEMTCEKDDKRKKRIVMTPEGYKAIEEVEETFMEITRIIEKDFTDEEKKTLSTLLGKIRLNVSK
jgi:DNA-binding MarR family transcriptional regulator